MGSRLNLQTLLEGLLGSRNVYFQPPASVIMQYPCIVYNRAAVDTKYANDKKYLQKKRYSVTVIDKNPDSLIPDKVSGLPLCSFDRHFKTDNLNHDIYSLYY